MVSTLLFPVLAAIAYAVPTHTPCAVHEKRSFAPAGYELLGPAEWNQPFRMRIGLKQSNMHRVEEILMSVSDPKSPAYGKHLSPQQVANLFAPSEETINTVKEWLALNGVHSSRVASTGGKGWLEFTTSVAEAESLLRTKYDVYNHEKTDDIQLATLEYTLPVHIQEHIDFITPTLQFNSVGLQANRLRKRGSVLSKRSENLESHLKYGRPFIAGLESTSTFASGTPSETATASASAASASGSIIPPMILNASDISATGTDECSLYMTPACLRALYNIPSNFSTNSNSSIGIVEYSPLSYLEFSDLNNFFNKFNPSAATSYNNSLNYYIVDGNFTLSQGAINQTTQPGANSSFDFGLHGEANLDVQFAAALTYPTRLNYYQVGQDNGYGSFNNFLDAIDGSYCTYEGGDNTTTFSVNGTSYPLDDPAFNKSQCGAFPSSTVISTSYGSDEVTLPNSYIIRQCSEYAKLGMMGVTIFYSAGDDGVGSGSGCITTTQFDGANTTAVYAASGDDTALFVPDFPASCPYITAVGATQVNPGASVSEVESVADVLLLQPDGTISTFAGGGGFSNVFGVPSYQMDTVNGWLNKSGSDSNQPPKSRYNSTGVARAYPDISTNGVNYTLALGDGFTYVYGTSASSPTAASLFSIINSERLNAGKSPIGFINPVLYQHTSAFNDVVSGNNPNPSCATNGFYAGEGWDPASGLGTPNYQKLLGVFMGLD